MIPTTVERVPQHTARHINERIRHQTEVNVAQYGSAGEKAIRQRLTELDQEWDMERTLEANAATLALVGFGLGAFVDRRFFALPAVVAGFLLQHAVQGWCPPVPIFRRLGVRTQPEIEQERFALKAIRGDFEAISEGTGEANDGRALKVMEAIRR